MKYSDMPYFHVGSARELSGRDKILYRAFEILPGVLSWGTLVGIILLSAFAPVYAAYFIIVFDLYWLLKTIFLSMHLRQNWRRVRHNMGIDWMKRLGNLHYDHLYHMVLLPFYKEGEEVIRTGLNAISDSSWDSKRIIIVLGAEERAGSDAKILARKLKHEYENVFGHFLITVHPEDIPGEMAGKGSNISYQAEEARKQILDKKHISYEQVIVSAFDIDTVVYPEYFSCLAWHFLTAENPYRVSFQPVPLYNNNVWSVPMLSRVVATSGTFWQMIQQERPERLATFSSHSMSFKSLYEIGYWQTNMVSEDSRIFWNHFLAYGGNYSVVPISYPVSMDANLASTFWQTMVNIYKQQRRWTWGVENVPYILFNFLKHKNISLKKKMRVAFVQIEGFWSLATNPLMIFLLGWLPLILGGREFNETILSYNLPIITRNLMFLAMSGLVFSAIISLTFLPKPPEEKKLYYRVSTILQWVFIPITMTFFGAFPGLDAQTRLMLGKYMGFWVTPKDR